MPRVTVTGLTEAEKRLQDMSQRVRDLTPAMKVVARQIEKETDDAFRASKSPRGEPWKMIKEETALNRKGGRKLKKRVNRRTKAGGLTKGAMGARGKLFDKGLLGAQAFAGDDVSAAQLAKPLIDTGRMRNSVNVKVSKRSVRFTAVGYMAPHMTGGENLPKRNPTVFEGEPGDFRLVPRIAQKLRETVARYVMRGTA